MTRDTSFYLSFDFVISCGTVPLNMVHTKILLVRMSEIREVILPRGRMNVGETLEVAALCRESGHKAKLPPLRTASMST